MHPLNFRQIRAFRAVMLLGSTAQAGREIGVSQPAISRLLRDLEHLAGCELFDRRQGRLVPTAEAEHLFQETHGFMANYDRVARSLSDMRQRGGQGAGHIRAFGTNALAHGLMPRAIALFQANRPNVTISLGITARDDIRKWINEQEFDIAVAALPLEYPMEELERLGNVSGVCLLPAGHRLASQQAIRAEDLEGEPYISLATSTVGRMRVDMVFERMGIKRQLPIDVQTSAAACELVCHGLGVCVIDPFTAERFRSRELVIKPFHPAINFEYACLFPVRHARSRFSGEFLECIRTAFLEFRTSPTQRT